THGPKLFFSNDIFYTAEPAGYESYFSSSYIPQYSGKQSRCLIDKVANKPLYRSNLTSLELVLEAVELSPTARVDYATVVVSVELANLNPPIITYNSNTGYIYENSPVGARPFIDATANTTLLKLTFTDPNRFSSDPPVPLTFTVRPETTFGVTQDGYVVLNSGTLDYEIKRSYVYSVTVTSNGLSSSETLTINILDNNDNVPVIQNDDPIVYVTPEIFNNPLTLRKLTATDIDFGPPLFSLLRVFPATLDVKFSVTGDGEVSLQGLIRPTDTYIVYISASDQGTPQQSSDAVVVISANRGTST
uniref:Cadherin domain-containing protein n=1 Tax=Biomphalaria glabrata TaxID=6526 RepID=A0A2C9L4Z0_BIOGL